MSKGVAQAQRSFITASCISLGIILILCWTGIMLLSNNPHLDPDNLLSYMIDNYTYTGLKGLTAAGIMAVIMSTADSYINSATVLFNHDILKPLNIAPLKPQNQLLLLRLVTIPMSFVAFIFAIKTESIFELLLKSYSFYMPVITVPLLFSILGFRSNARVVQMSMATGVITVIICNIFDSEINETVVGMLANLVVLVAGQWIYIKPKSDGEQRRVRATPLHSEFSLYSIFNKLKVLSCTYNSVLRYQSSFLLIGAFSLISTFSTVYSIPKETEVLYPIGLNVIYIVTLTCSSIIMTYSMWSVYFEKQSILPCLIVKIASIWSLITAPTLLVIMSGFGQYQLIMFCATIFLLAFIMSWQEILITLIIAVYSGIKMYQVFL